MSANSRILGCTILCLVPAVLISGRLSRLQILDRRILSSKAREETQRFSLEMTRRGRILDRSGKVLAESLPSGSVFLDPQAVRKPEAAVAALASVLQMPQTEIRRKLKTSSRFVWIKRKIDFDKAAALGRLHIEGIGIVPDQERYYPSGDLAQNLLGRVDLEDKGLSGLELEFDRTLAGKPIHIGWLRDGSGKAVMIHPEGPADDPPDIRLTLDGNIQHYAEAALADGISRYHPQKGLVMVQDPETGDILAVASFPYDPLKAYSIQDAYEPGSTYKLVTFAAILEEKLDVPGESIDGEGGRWEVAHSVFIKDHDPEGPMSLTDIIEKSSNIGSAKLGLRLGPEKFYNYSRAFGFGSKTSLAYPGESAGLLKTASKMTKVTLANNAFGQGLAVTPLQLLDAYSAIADGGVLMEPRLLLGIEGQAQNAPMKVRRVVSADTARRLTELLEGVVANGTGMSAQVPGYFVAGKTGTAQKIDPSTRQYSPVQYVGSFIGFAPSRNPKFTILVIMDSPKNQYYGSDVAAPIFSKLARELLALQGVPQDRPIEKQEKVRPILAPHRGSVLPGIGPSLHAR